MFYSIGEWAEGLEGAYYYLAVSASAIGCCLVILALAWVIEKLSE